MRYSTVVKFLTPIIALALLCWFLISRTDESTHTNSLVAIVKREDLVQRVTISGQLWPLRRLDVKPPFTGYVEKIFVKVGDKVKSGDPLVTFSPSLGHGETNFPVRSAFTGTVTQILRNEGEAVTEIGEQNLVLRVEDLTGLFVLAALPELDVAKVKIGQEASIRFSSLIGETFTGEISEISLSSKDKERWGAQNVEFQIKVRLNSKDPRLLPGMSALMDVITNRADQVLTLPHEYLQEENGQYFVTTSTGEKKSVTLGLQTEIAAEIRSGLVEGEKIRVIDFLNLPKLED